MALCEIWRRFTDVITPSDPTIASVEIHTMENGFSIVLRGRHYVFNRKVDLLNFLNKHLKNFKE